MRLPLYKDHPESPAIMGPRLDRDPICRRCPNGENATKVCIAADATDYRPKSPTLYVLGDQPGKQEDQIGRPLVMKTGANLRKLVSKHWKGSVVYDYAIRCRGGHDPVKAMEACLPYLRQNLDEVQPDRFLVVGRHAARALLGRGVQALTSLGATAWIRNDMGEEVPVYFTPQLQATGYNRFLARWLESTVRRAVNEDPKWTPPWDAEFESIQTVQDSKDAVAYLRTRPWFSYDCETAGRPWGKYFEIAALAACGEGSDLSHVWGREALKDPEILAPLLELLEDPSVGKVGHNLKFDMLAPRAAWGITVRGVHSDTRLKRKLIQADSNGGLDACSELVGMGGYKSDFAQLMVGPIKAIGRARRDAKKGQTSLFGVNDPILDAAAAEPHLDAKAFSYGLVQPEELERYCARDTVATTRLEGWVEPRLARDEGLVHIWDSVVHGATAAVEQIEAWGVPASRDAIENFSTMIRIQQDEVLARLRPYGDINYDAPDQVADLLYGTLNLPVLDRTDTGKPSTKKENLQKLAKAHNHPVLKDLMESRRLGKLQSAYGQTMAAHIRSDGRIHPELKIDGTETGRLSCLEPALHQMPRAETPEAKAIKDCFVASPGYRLIQLDYSQLELRVAAFLSGDEKMLEMFATGEDFHMLTAKLVSQAMWGISPDQCTKAHRSFAKAFIFGLLYGMTNGGLANRIGCSRAEAGRLRQAILGQYKQLAVWVQEKLQETRKTGVSRTWWAGETARKRPLWRVGNVPYDDKAQFQVITAENSAVNSPVQGTASEFCLRSIIDCVDWIQEEKVDAKLILTVHDSIIFEAREGQVPYVVNTAREIMQAHQSGGVFLKTDVEWGVSWGSLVDWEEAA